MPNTLSSNNDPEATSDPSSHRQLSAMIDAGRAFSGGERNCCFLNTRNGSFADLSVGSGLDFPDDGRAVAVTDWDQDGDLDLWISNRNAPRLRLMRNGTASENHFLALRLVGNGKETNRDAIGARVEVELRDDESGLRLVRSLRAGEGFLSQSSKFMHFGLGPHTVIDNVIVRWPNGENEVFKGLEADCRYRIVQGTAKAERLRKRDHSMLRLTPSAAHVANSAGAMRVPAVTLLRAPQLNVKRSDGSPVAIGDGAGEQKSLLINLWATWCGPCLTELREIRDRANELRAANIDVLALSVDGIGAAGQESKGPTSVEPMQVLAELDFPFPSTAATEPLVAALQELHNNMVGLNRPLPIPTSFLIDRDGRLSVIYKGAMSIDQLLADVGHSSGTLDERLDRSAQVKGSMIMLPEARRTARDHEASLHLRYSVARQAGNDFEGAQYHLLAALDLDPDSAPATKQLAQIYLAKREWNKAADQFEIAIRLNPDDADGHLALAQLRSRLGQPDQARPHYLESLRRKPENALAHFDFAALLAAQGEPAAAVSHYRDGLKLQPDNKVAANNLAWLFATHHSGEIRDPAEALRIALEINTASGDQVPNILDTMSAAQAASGDFAAAAETVRRAIVIAKTNGDDAFAVEMTQRLTLYQAGKPYLEAAVRVKK